MTERSHPEVTVPPGARAGEEVQFTDPNGNSICATIPAGLRPGDVFHVTAGDHSTAEHPLLEVEVPAGACSGMEVTFHGPDGKAHTATVPEGLKPGDVFHVELADNPQVLSF